MLWTIIKKTYWGLQNMFWWSAGWCSLITFVLWLCIGSTGVFVGVVITGTVLAVCSIGCLSMALSLWMCALLGLISEADVADEWC